MKKLRNKKTIILSLCALAAISLGTVGFAAWTITAGDATPKTSNIAVTTDDLIDKRLTLSDINVDEGIVNFTANTDTSGTITGDGTEDLSFKISFTISSGNAALNTIVDSVKVGFYDLTTGDTKLNTIIPTYILSPIAKADKTILTSAPTGASDDGVVEVLAGATLGTNVGDTNVPYNTRYPDDPDVTSEKPAYTYSVSGTNEQKTTATVSITFNFLWSSVFNYNNPVLIDGGQNNYTVPEQVENGLKAIDAINNDNNQIKIGLKLFVTAKE